MNLSSYFTKKPTLHLGVDIGFGSLKIVLLQMTSAQTTLLAYKCEDISNIKDDEQLNDFILQQVDDFIKSHGISRKIIHLNLSITNSVYTKTIKLPYMLPKEIPNAAKWQIKDEIPININEVEFVWQYTSSQSKIPKPRIEIICVAAKKDFLNKYIELFRRSNISLAEMTFSPFSINTIIPASDEWTGALDIGHKQSVFSLHSKGRILFLRAIHVGADNFKTQEPEQLKLNTEHLSDEIVRCIKYCEIEFTKQAVNNIYLTGGGAKIETLQAQLKEISGLDIKMLRFPRDIQVDENIRKDYEANRISLQILPAIGAAISSASKIDILPLEAKTEKLLLAQRISFRLIGLAALLILLLSTFAARLNLDITKKRLRNAEAELAFLREAEIIKIEIDEYNKVINQIKQEHVSPGWAIKFISNTIPENMVLNSFVFNNKDRFINIIGIIYTKETSAEAAIKDFTRNLKQVELFQDAQLVSLEKTTGDSFTFNIVCNLIK